MPRLIKKSPRGSPRKKPSDRNCDEVNPTPTQARKLKEQAQVAKRLLSFREKHNYFISSTTGVTLRSIIHTRGCSDIDEMTWADFIKEQQTDLQKQKTGLKKSIEERIIELKNQMVELRSI